MEVVERVRPGRWRMRLQNTDYSYQNFGMRQVWEPGTPTRESMELCNLCNGTGFVTEEELANAALEEEDY